MLAQKAGLFVLTLVDDVGKGFNLHYINSVIERLRLVECVHIHLLIGASSSDKFQKKNNREMNWVLGELTQFRISSISQEHIARIEEKLNHAFEILQKWNQKATTAKRTFVPLYICNVLRKKNEQILKCIASGSESSDWSMIMFMPRVTVRICRRLIRCHTLSRALSPHMAAKYIYIERYEAQRTVVLG